MTGRGAAFVSGRRSGGQAVKTEGGSGESPKAAAKGAPVERSVWPEKATGQRKRTLTASRRAKTLQAALPSRGLEGRRVSRMCPGCPQDLGAHGPGHLTPLLPEPPCGAALRPLEATRRSRCSLCLRPGGHKQRLWWCPPGTTRTGCEAAGLQGGAPRDPRTARSPRPAWRVAGAHPTPERCSESTRRVGQPTRASSATPPPAPVSKRQGTQPRTTLQP